MHDTLLTPPRPWYYPQVFLDQVVQGVLALIEFVLALRFILMLLGASANAPFVAWFYHLTDAIIAPFQGAFPTYAIGGFIIDFSSLFAMIGYGIIAWLFLRLVGFFSYLR